MASVLNTNSSCDFYLQYSPLCLAVPSQTASIRTALLSLTARACINTCTRARLYVIFMGQKKKIDRGSHSPLPISNFFLCNNFLVAVSRVHPTECRELHCTERRSSVAALPTVPSDSRRFQPRRVLPGHRKFFFGNPPFGFSYSRGTTSERGQK